MAGRSLALVLLVSMAMSACSTTTQPETPSGPTTTSIPTADARPWQLTFNKDEDWSHGFSPDGTRSVTVTRAE